MYIFYKRVKLFYGKPFIFGFFLILAGCQSIFFFPYREIVWTPDNIGYAYNIHKLQVNEEEYVTLWEVLPKNEIRGTILYFHGNAENISTHIQSMMWLVGEGYRVFGLDYRGYGQSNGEANVENAVEDIQMSLGYVIKNIPKLEKLVVFSQSIGAALAIHALSNSAYSERVSLFIFDSSFSSYESIAEDKLSEMGLFYPMSTWVSNLATDCCDPVKAISSYPSSKVIIVHVEDDQVVPYRHSTILHEAIGGAASFWHNKTGGHTSYFSKRGNRLELLKVLGQ